MIRRLYNWVCIHSFYISVVVWAIFMVYVLSQATYVSEPEPEVVYKTVTQTVYEEIHSEEQCGRLEPFYRTIAEQMTPDEYHLLAALVNAEAGGESFTGQRAVVEVVFNRVLSDKFPGTVTDVIYQKNQFSTLKRLHRVEPTQEQYDAIDATLRCVEPILLKEVLFFASVKMDRPLYEQIGCHNFYYSKE